MGGASSAVQTRHAAQREKTVRVHVLIAQVLLAMPMVPPLVAGCKFFGKMGTNYADTNLSVAQLGNTSTLFASCCDACYAWNDAKPAPETNCSIGVVLSGRLCALKASSLRPFPSRHATAVQPPSSSKPGPEPAMANLDLVVLPQATADKFGAKCLDGSAPALYFKAANTSADSSAATKWVLFFKGGGWCDDEVSCSGRALGLLGSSSRLNATQPKFGYGGGGPVGADPTQNPSFANFNRVIMWYVTFPATLSAASSDLAAAVTSRFCCRCHRHALPLSLLPKLLLLLLLRPRLRLPAGLRLRAAAVVHLGSMVHQILRFVWLDGWQVLRRR